MSDFSNVTIPGLSQTKVSGLSELEASFKEFIPKAARKAFRNAGFVASQIWVDSMEELAPVRHSSGPGREPGFLRGSIGASVRVSAANEALIVHVGPSKAAYYGGFNEFGTSHMAAHPFMRPTFQNHQDDVLAVFVDELWNSLKDLEQK
jgi:HK97 gp10 family phage protein